MKSKKFTKIEMTETSSDDGHYNLTFELEADFSEELMELISGFDPGKTTDLEIILEIAIDQAYICFNEGELIDLLYRTLPNQEILDFEGVEAGSVIKKQTPSTYEEALKMSKTANIVLDIQVPIKAKYALEKAIENCVQKILEK